MKRYLIPAALMLVATGVCAQVAEAAGVANPGPFTANLSAGSVQVPATDVPLL